MKTKTIIISSPEGNSNSRGIVSIYIEDDLLKCRMRTYSMPKLSSAIKFAVYHHEEVFSANIIERNGVYETSLVGQFNIDHDFYCAIIDTANNNKPILAGGTYSGFFFNDTSVFNKDNIEEDISTESIDDCDESCDKCANCKYKEYFYASNKPINTQNIEEIDTPTHDHEKEEIKEENTPNILSSIIPQFDYIFEHYDANIELNNLIPNSKFVQVKEGSDNYSIGALYDESNLKIICYAVRSRYNTPAPMEIGDHYQWVPLDREDPLSDGYYIVFQDANDLKIIEL